MSGGSCRWDLASATISASRAHAACRVIDPFSYLSLLPNPNSARELPAFAREAGLKDLKTEVHAIYTPHEFFLRSMAGSLIKAAEVGIVPRAEVEECLAEQAALRASGDFFQIWIFVHVTGTV